MISIKYVDKLQKQNADDLAFYPLTSLQEALDTNHIIWCEENNEPAGYLWFGAIRGGFDTIIYQACVDYDARRQHLGFGMLQELIDLCRVSGSIGIRLKCASSAESNIFWKAAGFTCTNVKQGGIKRGRDINYYRTDIVDGFWTPDLFYIPPSNRPIDLTNYNKLKKEKSKMPNRFSRTHY